MIRLVYTIGIRLYGVFLLIAGMFHSKAAKWVDGRKNLFAAMEPLRLDKAPKAWFHVASLGEFEQARPLIEAYRKLHPQIKILITFFSPSGYEIRKNYSGADYIYYLPLDTPQNARQLLDIVRPSIIFFVKYEFWYNLLIEIQYRKIPVYLVSGIFRADQHFFKTYGGWFRGILKGFDHLFVQNKASLQLLQHHGIMNCSVSGDTRFDRVADVLQSRKKLPLIEEFIQSSLIVVGGSTWPPEEELLSELLIMHSGTFKLIVAPHDIDGEHCEEIRQRFGGQSILYSEAQDVERLRAARVLIIDNIGMLTSVYGYADIAVVGGGFKTGLHNVLEPAAFGIPVVFGPQYGKFDEARGLLAAAGGFSARTQQEMAAMLAELIEDGGKRRSAGREAGHFVQERRGAADKILHHIAQI